MALPPSAAVYVALSKFTFTAGTSSSVIDTVLVDVVPAETPVGSEPKARATLSSSSSTLSAVAAKVNVFSVSEAPKVRFAGTPE